MHAAERAWWVCGVGDPIHSSKWNAGIGRYSCQSRRKKGPFAGVKVGQLRCRALLGVLPIKLTRDKAHVGQRPTSIKFRPGSGSGVSALF